jgi:hypothetical protein
VVFVVTYVLLLAACSGGDMGSLRIASDVFVSSEDGWAPNEVARLSGPNPVWRTGSVC